MGANAATQERPVLIVHPETRDSQYVSNDLTPLSRQLLLNEWGFEDLLPAEKDKLEDSVIALFNYASSFQEQLLVRVDGNHCCVSSVDVAPASVHLCLELLREKPSFVIGVPISELPAVLKLQEVEQVAAA